MTESLLRQYHEKVARLEASEAALSEAIEAHRRNIMSLGRRKDERTGAWTWGGQFDRDLWRVLGEGYPTDDPQNA